MVTEMHYYMVFSTNKNLLSIPSSLRRQHLSSQVHTPTNYIHLHKKTKKVVIRSLQSNQASPYLAVVAVLSATSL